MNRQFALVGVALLVVLAVVLRNTPTEGPPVVTPPADQPAVEFQSIKVLDPKLAAKLRRCIPVLACNRWVEVPNGGVLCVGYKVILLNCD